jgi:hypothetical protein
MFVSGWVEIVFGVSVLIVPLLVIEAVGGTGAGAATLALIRLLGAATLGLGVAALLARNHLDGGAGLAAAYGLGLYNVLGLAFFYSPRSQPVARACGAGQCYTSRWAGCLFMRLRCDEAIARSASISRRF